MTRLTVDPLEERCTPTIVPPGPFVASGLGTGTGLLYSPVGGQYSNSPAAVTLLPGINAVGRSSVGDVNGDGTLDIVSVTGQGFDARVVVADGSSPSALSPVILANFRVPLPANFTGGLFVATGDFNTDGKADVAVTPDLTGTPRVFVYNGISLVNGTASPALLANFLGIASLNGQADTAFQGGARVAVGDVNGDSVADLLVTAGNGGGPRVTVWNGKGIGAANGGQPTINPIANLFVFEASQRDGAYVASGDVNVDGNDDLVFGGGPNGGPRVRIVDARALLQLTPSQLEGVNLDQNLSLVLSNFFAGDQNARGGVRVEMTNMDGDSSADLITGSGTGQFSRVLVYRGSVLRSTGATATPAVFQTFNPFNQVPPDGVYVG